MEQANLTHIRGKRILFGPADWGMGHLSRSVPIIAQLLQHNELYIGCSESSRRYLDAHFPDRLLLPLPSYKVRYSSVLPAWLAVLFQMPRLIRVLYREKKRVQQLVEQLGIDLVISDSRYGFRMPGITSVCITHQLNLQLPVFSAMVNRLHRKQLNRFTELWVPDNGEEGKRLAGKLSDTRGVSIALRYLGPLSALRPAENISDAKRSDILVLLSGPEPQRSILERILLEKFAETAKRVVLIRGSESPFNGPAAKLQVLDLVHGTELAEWIGGAKQIICRSGYSTLMDLFILGKKNMLLIPTPGQPEQEYLANWWKEQFSAQSCRQADLPGLSL